MRLTTIPADFSPILADNFFHFEDVDPSVSTEIHFFDDKGEGLGARRYAGRTVIDSSPRAFLSLMLDPQPAVRGSLAVLRPEGRQVELSVAVGADGEHSSGVRFAANVARLEPSAVVGPAEQSRVIASGEYDEFSLLLAEGDDVTLECQVEGRSEVTLLRYVCPEAGYYTVVFEAEDLFNSLGEEQEPERLSLRVKIGGALKGTLLYTVVPAAQGECRLAWLDAYGAIRHYTFRILPEESLEVARRESDTLQGVQTLEVESWNTVVLRSGPLTSGQMEFLKGVISSPRVWQLVGREWVPVTIGESVCRCAGKGARSVELRLRSAKRTKLW